MLLLHFGIEQYTKKDDFGYFHLLCILWVCITQRASVSGVKYGTLHPSGGMWHRMERMGLIHDKGEVLSLSCFCTGGEFRCDLCTKFLFSKVI